MISPIHSVNEVPIIILSHVPNSKGTVRNTAPPNWTINICPIKMRQDTTSKPYEPGNAFQIDSCVPDTLVLNKFQN